MDAAGAAVERCGQAWTEAQRPAFGGGRHALRHPSRLPVALPAVRVRAVDAGVVAVSTLVAQRHVGDSASRAARAGAVGSGPGGTAVDVGRRLRACTWCGAGRGVVPRPGRPVRCDVGGEARCRRRRHRTARRAVVVPASTTESRATELLLEHLEEVGVTARLELVLVDRGTTARAARSMSRRFGLEVRRVFWPDKAQEFRPLPHAWRVEVAHGRIGRSRRLAKSFENTPRSSSAWLRIACVNLLLQQLAPAQ